MPNIDRGRLPGNGIVIIPPLRLRLVSTLLVGKGLEHKSAFSKLLPGVS